VLGQNVYEKAAQSQAFYFSRSMAKFYTGYCIHKNVVLSQHFAMGIGDSNLGKSTFPLKHKGLWDEVTYQPVTKKNADGFPFPGETGGKTDGTTRVTGFTNIDPHITDCAALTETMAHEIGHAEGLGECTQCGSTPGTSVMIGKPCVPDSTGTQCASPQVPDYNNSSQGLPAPTTSDNTTVGGVYSPSGGGGGGVGILDPCFGRFGVG